MRSHSYTFGYYTCNLANSDFQLFGQALNHWSCTETYISLWPSLHNNLYQPKVLTTETLALLSFKNTFRWGYSNTSGGHFYPFVYRHLWTVSEHLFPLINWSREDLSKAKYVPGWGEGMRKIKQQQLWATSIIDALEPPLAFYAYYLYKTAFFLK